MPDRICSRCGTPKPLTDYYRSAKSREGRMPWCKRCHAVRVAKNRADRIARDYEHFRALARVADAKYHRENPGKYKARQALRRAVRKGAVEQESCIFCGDPNTHGHHHDYSKPLDVTWVCAHHHGLIHRKVDEAV